MPAGRLPFWVCGSGGTTQPSRENVLRRWGVVHHHRQVGFIILAAVFGFLLIIGLIILLVYCTCIEKRGPPPGQPLCCCWKTEREAMTEPPTTYFLFPLNPPGNPEENLPCPSTHWVMYPGQATSDVVQVSNANQISLRTY
ncbi:uncharacterized protein LOC124858171 isoform X2 [Girardinichthys multiradiatus]|uniref:uncharacterized protein LOC124858171 isoform X2 n=1 Tax=Girardinichthys multiradiatus TaxID=208333 RepID=UPI001FAC89C6|nr:uncharacterized protein LOC124858171 isoform X2 [Girardinichthys multiradiatus]